jgi:hypothetical protein
VRLILVRYQLNENFAQSIPFRTVIARAGGFSFTRPWQSMLTFLKYALHLKSKSTRIAALCKKPQSSQ